MSYSWIFRFFFTVYYTPVLADLGMSDSAKVLARSRLRAHFLRTLSSLASEACPCSVRMVDGPPVTGVLRAADLGLEHLGVSQLATPIGTLTNAILRTCDIISITFHIDQLSTDAQKIADREDYDDNERERQPQSTSRNLRNQSKGTSLEDV